MKEVSEDTREWLKQKWVRIGPDGKILGPCGDREEDEGKPKCLPLAKAKSMSKKDLKSAVSRKRKHDPKVERKGKAKFVPTFKEEFSDEEMKKAKELLTGPVLVKEEYLIEKNEPTNPKLWSQAKALAKKKFKIYPSAYANLWASKWYKKRGGGWKDDQPVNESSEEDHPYTKHVSRLRNMISNRLDDLHNAGEISTDEKKQRSDDLARNIAFINKLILKKEERQSTMKTTKDLFLEQLDIAQYGHIVEKDDGKDHEYEMARSQLATSATAIKRLMEKLGKGEGNLQAWVQSKLTKASDYIDSVADYMDAKDPVVKEAVELSNQVKELFDEVVEDYEEETKVQYMVDKEGHKLDGEIIESYEVKSNGRVKVKTASGTGYIKEENIVEMDLGKSIRRAVAAGMIATAAAASPAKATEPVNKPAEPVKQETEKQKPLTPEELSNASPVHSRTFRHLINSNIPPEELSRTLFKNERTVFTNHNGVRVIAKQGSGNKKHLIHLHGLDGKHRETISLLPK